MAQAGRRGNRARRAVNVPMRIVGGEFGGTVLSAPKGRTTRPTGERTREALFSVLASQADFSLARARVLDLFAGTGALGLEALSRGGDFCLFVENDTRVRGTLRDNCDACGVLGRTKIYRRDATRLGPRVSTAGPVFNLVFADPPYGKNWPRPRWARWRQATGWRTTPCWWLKKTGVRALRHPPASPKHSGAAMAIPSLFS